MKSGEVKDGPRVLFCRWSKPNSRSANSLPLSLRCQVPGAAGVAVVVFLLGLQGPVVVVVLVGHAAIATPGARHRRHVAAEQAAEAGARGVAEVASALRVQPVADVVAVRVAVHETALVGPDRLALLDLQAEQAFEFARRAAADQLQALVVAAAALGGAGAQVDVDAIEFLLQDDIDHPGDGIRAVDRRGAAAEDLDAVDHDRRDVRQVGEVHRAAIGGRVVGDAPAVDQHQRVVGAEIAQVEGVGRRLPGVAVVLALGHAGVLGLRLQGLEDVAVATVLDFLAADHRDRRRPFLLGAGNPRAGHHHPLQGLLRFRRQRLHLRRRYGRAQRRGGNHRAALGTAELQAATAQGLFQGLVDTQRTAHRRRLPAAHQRLLEGDQQAALSRDAQQHLVQRAGGDVEGERLGGGRGRLRTCLRRRGVGRREQRGQGQAGRQACGWSMVRHRSVPPENMVSRG